jgi:hypothetical protein
MGWVPVPLMPDPPAPLFLIVGDPEKAIKNSTGFAGPQQRLQEGEDLSAPHCLIFIYDIYK